MRIKYPGKFWDALAHATEKVHQNKPELILFGMGVIVGIVQTMAASGTTLETALKIVRRESVEEISEACIPDHWRDYWRSSVTTPC